MSKELYHYVYKIEFSTGQVYYGSRSCNCLPSDDFKYLGSPRSNKGYWKNNILVKVILREFDTRLEANEYENVLIEWAWSIDKSLSLNASIQGIKFNQEGRSPSKEVREKISRSSRKPKSFEQVDKRAYNFTLYNPDGEEIKGRNISKFARENNLLGSAMIAVLNGKKFHYKGWTSSLEAHRLYVKSFKMRGISYDSEKKLWRTVWYENKKQITKRFKTVEGAKNFRDNLVLNGYEYTICISNWKEKLKNEQY